MYFSLQAQELSRYPSTAKLHFQCKTLKIQLEKLISNMGSKASPPSGDNFFSQNLHF